MISAYTLEKRAEDAFLIIGPDGLAIKNHMDEDFPALSENVARNLCQDLNDINKKNRGYLKQEDDGLENAFLLMDNELLGNELRESFAYCVISTMMHAKGRSFDLDIAKTLQWDRVFRLSPGPPQLQLELGILEKAKTYLKSPWVNLPLNYSHSLAEMKEEGIEFVPDDILNELVALANSMPPVERFMVDLIYNYMDCFSITLPILWVAGHCNEDYLVDAYGVFKNGVNPDELEAEPYEELRFLKNRLLFLKTIRYSYSWNDETLPM